MTKPATVLPFNPLVDEKCMLLFGAEPEDFADYVKAAAIFYIADMTADRRVMDAVKKYLRVQITTANEIKMHEWGPEYEGRPVQMNCLVIGESKSETYTKTAEMYCEECNSRVPVKSLGMTLMCKNKDCDRHGEAMRLDPTSVSTGYHKKILIQEPLEEARHGRPMIFDAIVKDDDVRNTFIGQRKKVIIVFRSIGQKFKSTNSIVGNIVTQHDIDDVEEIQPTDGQKKQFQDMSSKPDYLDIIAESIAPEIKHETLSKICLLLGMVGCPKNDRIRGDIHALLVGGPALGKSKMLEYTTMLRKKSAFAVGGTMSGTGVTISMDTLPNRTKMPRAGIIPQCHGGHVAIDEGNQLQEEDQGKLYECMESSMIHYNKGGFDMTLDAATTILMGANPRFYTWSEEHDILSNIHMPEPLVSRFDLLMNMDGITKSHEQRQQILDHINLVDKIGVTEYIKKAGLLQPQELSAYLSYCRQFSPVFDEQSDAMIKDFQLHMEALERKNGDLPIDNRFYYAIRRISKAVARMHFSNMVRPEHVMIAIEIKKKTLQTFGMKTEKGQLQQNIKTAPSKKKDKQDAFIETCKALQGVSPDGRFTDREWLGTAMLNNPGVFESEDHAMVYFVKMAKERLQKTNGRYKLD